jgi:hypothetical protein
MTQNGQNSAKIISIGCTGGKISYLPGGSAFMRQYNVFQAIFMSFYSQKLYRDVAKNWNGHAVWYLLFILVLSWIPMTYVIQYVSQRYYNENANALVPQIPVLNIENGRISTPEQKPYFIKDPKTNETIAIIDTTGTYTDINKEKTLLLITPTEVISKPKPGEVRIDQIPTNVTGKFDPQDVNQTLKKYLPYSWIFIFPIAVILSFIYRLIQSLIYGIIGKFISAISRVPLTYGQIVLIMMVAITPVIVLATIFDVFGITFNYQLLLYFILAMIYLIFGILANKTVNVESSTPKAGAS